MHLEQHITVKNQSYAQALDDFGSFLLSYDFIVGTWKEIQKKIKRFWKFGYEKMNFEG